MTSPPRLRVVLLYSSGHVGSAVVFNLLAGSGDSEIVGVVRAPPFKPGVKAMKKHLRKMGWRFSWMLVWQRFAQGAAMLASLLLAPFSDKRPYLPGWYLALRDGVPVHFTDNVNDAATIAFVRDKNADLLVSAYFSHILKVEIIRLPRLGVLNIHPGGLPAYKGAMSYFWALKNNEARAAATLHWINEGIDTGDIVRRRSFAVHRNTTQHQVLVATAIIGGYMIRSALRKLRYGLPLPATPQPMGGGDDYYSMPAEKDFEHYFRTRRFFRLRDVFSATLRRIRDGKITH